MSTGTFNTGLSGLLAARRALVTTGHNISNVSTPGYSRQRVDLSARAPFGTSSGFVGNGVDIQSVNRQVDAFSTAQVRTSTSAFTGFDRFHQLSSQIDNLLGDSSGGLSPAMQNFFEAAQSLTSDPASIPARQVLLSEAKGLIQRFQAMEQRLGDHAKSVDSTLSGAAVELTAFASDVADLNQEILLAEGATGGYVANDLRDQRDEMVRKISELSDVTVIEQGNGMLNVFLGKGQPLVIGGQASVIALEEDQYDASVRALVVTSNGSSTPIGQSISGGEIGAILRFRDEVLDPTVNAVGRIAIALSSEVNRVHETGMDLANQTGNAFFTDLRSVSPSVYAHSNNTGSPAADVAAQIIDTDALTSSDYQITRSGASYLLTRLSDGQETTLSTFPGAAQTVDGLRFSLASGAIADGDRFLIKPTRNASGALGLAVTDPRSVAAASPVEIQATLANTGTAAVSAPAVNLSTNALQISFTAGNAFDVVDNTTGATLATGLSYTSGGSIAFNGMTFSISGVPQSGDIFDVANHVSSAASANAGTGAISDPSVAAHDPNLRDAVSITFDDPPSTFTVSGATTGTPVATVSYTAGDPISFNGWTLEITGAPAAGDVFSLSSNANAVGDNRNALRFAGLQTIGTMSSSTATFEESYGQLVAQVGTDTRQAELSRDAQFAVLGQAQATRESLSGVNLDEEAANLLRFQQAYQASAQVISISDTLFQAVLDATR